MTDALSGPATRRAKQGRVLISEPCSWDLDILGLPFLPYLWGLLKTHHEHHGADPDYWEWLEPIYRYCEPDSFVETSLSRPIDILGLSCYTWNWRLQCRIAAATKARYPECLVVAGGPQPDYGVPGFFSRHPYFDAVAVRDGEITFSRLLDTWASGDRDLDSVKGLYLPDRDAATGQRFTGPPDVPTGFEHSPYVAQSDFYQKAVVDSGNNFGATWESNRGCPFACNFCDWGSATMSKVRRFPLERVTADLEWLGQHGAAVIFLADANFGMLPRDVDLAVQVGEIFRKYGRPTSLSYNYAKNSPARSVAISKALFESGMPYKHTLSIQHTRPEVLAAADRENISSAQQIEVVQEIMKHGIPVEVQLILGIPGDNYRHWQGCFGDLMEWGIHGQYQVYVYHLLPNAPAAAAAFREKWQIQTVQRCVYTSPHLGHITQQTVLEQCDVIVSSASYGVEDWVRMNAYGEVIKALHSGGLTHLIAHYLRRTHGVSYEAFYSALVDEWAVHTRWYQGLTDHVRRFTTDEKATEFMTIEELPRHPHQVAAFQWVIIQMSLSPDSLYESLSRYLLAKYPQAANLASLLQYQSDVLILPDYDSREGKTFATDLDWPGYFARVFEETVLAEPLPGSGGRCIAADRSSIYEGNTRVPLDWHNAHGEDRWSAWIDRIVRGWNGGGRANFQDLTLVPHAGLTTSANRLQTSQPE